MKTRQNTKETTIIGVPSQSAKRPLRWFRSLRAMATVALLATAVSLTGTALAAVVSDFTLIRGDSPIRIGDGFPVWSQTFNTGGRHAASPGYLVLNVKHLTHTPLAVEVRINGAIVGYIYPYAGGWDTAENWYSQTIAFNGTSLNNGNNELEIRAVSFPGATFDNLYDDFYLKGVICHFHQSS